MLHSPHPAEQNMGTIEELDDELDDEFDEEFDEEFVELV